MRYLHEHRFGQFIKYYLVGGLVVAVNLAVLYALTDLAHIYYLYSAVGAFAVSFCVSYVLQKYWTFRDHSREDMHVQAFFYLLLQLVNVSANLALLYIFVQYFHVWYLLAQAIIAILLGLVIFFLNKKFIFNKKTP